MTEQQNWRLSIGIHRGTMMSRDNNVVYEHFDDPSKPLTSLEECRETAKKWEQNYHSLGCVTFGLLTQSLQTVSQPPFCRGYPTGKPCTK